MLIQQVPLHGTFGGALVTLCKIAESLRPPVSVDVMSRYVCMRVQSSMLRENCHVLGGTPQVLPFIVPASLLFPQVMKDLTSWH